MAPIKHGFAKRRDGGRAPEYGIWLGIKKRCCNPRSKSYANYGGRGITICAEWLNDFAAFLADVGPRPTPAHTIDRIDNAKSYEPGNCRWATQKEQQVNRRDNHVLDLDGKTMTLSEAGRRFGIGQATIRYRLMRGWCVRDAVTLPPSPLAREARASTPLNKWRGDQTP